MAGTPVERDDLKQYLILLAREIESGKLVIEGQRLLIAKQAASGLDQSATEATLTRLLKAQRDLEDTRDQLAKEFSV